MEVLRRTLCAKPAPNLPSTQAQRGQPHNDVHLRRFAVLEARRGVDRSAGVGRRRRGGGHDAASARIPRACTALPRPAEGAARSRLQLAAERLPVVVCAGHRRGAAAARTSGHRHALLWVTRGDCIHAALGFSDPTPPCVPAAWPQAEVRARSGGASTRLLIFQVPLFLVVVSSFPGLFPPHLLTDARHRARRYTRASAATSASRSRTCGGTQSAGSRSQLERRCGSCAAPPSCCRARRRRR